MDNSYVTKYHDLRTPHKHGVSMALIKECVDEVCELKIYREGEKVHDLEFNTLEEAKEKMGEISPITSLEWGVIKKA